jgi:hypothetical protein
MAETFIPFGEWLPDQGDWNNPGVTVAKNVLPHPQGFEPFPAEVETSNALTGYCRGAISGADKDGAQFVLAGDETKLNELSDTSWNDVSVTAAAYSTAAGEGWEFAKWKEQILCTNYTNVVQTWTIGAAQATNLGGSPPQARHIAVARDFVILGNINDVGGDGVVPYRVNWSGYQNEATWAVSASTQADKNDLLGSGGAVQRIFGGEYAVVFQENTSWRMTYAGTPIIWQFDEITPGHGLLAPGMAAQLGDVVFFLSPRGFMAMTNGQSIEPIGATKVDQFVLSDIDEGNLIRCSSVVDPAAHKVFFAYPGSDSTSGLANKMVIYDYSIGRWSYSEQDTEYLFSGGQGVYTLETLDNINSSLDALPYSLDSSYWTGRRLQLAKFTTNSKLALFTGSPQTASIETAEFQANQGRRSMVTMARPLVDAAGSATLTLGIKSRNRLQDAESTVYSTLQSGETDGQFALRNNARYHRMQLDVTGTWSLAQGLDVTHFPVGWR